MAFWNRNPMKPGGANSTSGDASRASRKDTPSRAQGPVLHVENLDVYYGRAHALQTVSFDITAGVLGIVGRNGMGKSTLCNAITGMVPATGSVRLLGEEVLGRSAHEITRRGIAYVPQGRRVWPSLTVDETLKLVASHRREVDRVYTMFPRLAERKSNGGAQLSGGEQQMLAIGRALLLDPKLLVMDEPTEGLAPVIVEQVAQSLKRLAHDGEVAVLLIEQNLGVALDVADHIGVMVNGRIVQFMPADQLAADREMQERLLGVKSAAEEESSSTEPSNALPGMDARDPQDAARPTVFRVTRAHGDGTPSLDDLAPRTVRGFNRWNSGDASARIADVPRDAVPDGLRKLEVTPSVGAMSAPRVGQGSAAHSKSGVLAFPVSATSGRAAYVAGTFDTKGRELFFLRQKLEKLGLRVVTVDLSTSGAASTANVHPREVARHHPQGESAVFSGDRGTAVTAMALAFEHFILTRRDVGGLISAGGSGGTSLATPAMRALPVGVPKMMVSTMASGDTRPYVGPSDICMMHSVTDVQGINRISEKVLANAAHALAGMITHVSSEASHAKPALGFTMFGVTTPCVQGVTKQLADDYDCLVFHATGVGGQSMEKLAESGLLQGVIDISTTEVADEIGGGILSAGPGRMDVFAKVPMPYVGSCGALDMVNFGPFASVPAQHKQRNLYKHNPTVTLMRTTAEECQLIGDFIARKLNAMRGPVRFLIPEGGVSALDKPGAPFHDPQANRVLFEAIASQFRTNADKKLIRLPHHINDEAFINALVQAWREVAPRDALVRTA
jgi:uncharacterized protein (UPF0261 family)/ABC-type branched-subunit amino acid transport system ATPase component